MDFSLITTLIFAYLIGALPIGYYLLKSRGIDPRRSAAYNLGPANSLRLLGPESSLLSFGIDVLKGFFAVGIVVLIGPKNLAPLAGLFAYIGHLFPPQAFLPPTPSGGWPIRGRGNAILLGILTGLSAFAGLSFLLAIGPLVIWAIVLARTGFLAAATLTGVLVLSIETFFLPWGAFNQIAAVTLLAIVVWRFKENIGRMLDKTEPKLDEIKPIDGENPNQIIAAFLIHPLTIEDVWKSWRAILLKGAYKRGLIPESFLKWILKRLRPIKVGELRGIYTKDGKEIRCLLIGGFLLPEIFKEEPQLAKERAVQAARLAHELGASILGLGAFFSTVADKGQEIQDAVPEIKITNGGAYTAGTIKEALPKILEHQKKLGRDLKNLTAAIVGANGVVAFGMARLAASEVGKVILIGRDLQRLERTKITLEKAFKDTNFVVSVDPHDCIEADLIFTATSDPNPVIFAKDVKPGAWIYDEGRPADVDNSVLSVAGVRLIPGGVVRPPGSMIDSNGWAKGNLGFGDGQVPACLAETLIIAANQAWDRVSLGETTKTENINYLVTEANRLGFSVID